jgi:hypothetical protein
MEDVELGVRLRQAGQRIRLCPEVQAKHLKRWTLASLWHTDIFARAIPWTRLILRQGRLSCDLNLNWRSRLSALGAWALLACTLPVLALGGRQPSRGHSAGGVQPALLRHAPLFGQVGIGGAGEASAQLPAAFTLIPAAMAAPVAPVAAASRLFGTSLLQGMAGLLLSPSRGLLAFSPAMVFALWGFVRVFRDSRFGALRPVALAALALFLVVARWFGWAGGWCYGPRLLVDVVTLLTFLAIPVAEEVRRRRALAVAFGVCLTWAVAVQFVGAFAYDVVGWNDRPFFVVKRAGEGKPLFFTDPDEARREAWARGGSVEQQKIDVTSGQGESRLWSIRDSQILYYVEHFFEARKLKQIAIQEFLRDRG